MNVKRCVMLNSVDAEMLQTLVSAAVSKVVMSP